MYCKVPFFPEREDFELFCKFLDACPKPLSFKRTGIPPDWLNFTKMLFGLTSVWRIFFEWRKLMESIIYTAMIFFSTSLSLIFESFKCRRYFLRSDWYISISATAYLKLASWLELSSCSLCSFYPLKLKTLLILTKFSLSEHNSNIVWFFFRSTSLVGVYFEI